MTAWWSSTTSVRKVRARSSAALRALVLGAALISAGTADWEMVVMCPPPGEQIMMLPPRTRFSKGRFSWIYRHGRHAPPLLELASPRDVGPVIAITGTKGTHAGGTGNDDIEMGAGSVSGSD